MLQLFCHAVSVIPHVHRVWCGNEFCVHITGPGRLLAGSKCPFIVLAWDAFD